ncbi:hypothetical protein RVM27_03355 [Halomonas sp. KM007]
MLGDHALLLFTEFADFDELLATAPLGLQVSLQPRHGCMNITSAQQGDDKPCQDRHALLKTRKHR